MLRRNIDFYGALDFAKEPLKGHFQIRVFLSNKEEGLLDCITLSFYISTDNIAAKSTPAITYVPNDGHFEKYGLGSFGI